VSELKSIKSPVYWQDIVLSFRQPDKRTTRAKERLSACRLPAIGMLQAALTWRLTDIASDTEALDINGGHVVIDHLLYGGAADAAALRLYGQSFSGAADAYPVVAAVLDSAGGLALVRFFSLLCMLVAGLCVARIGRHLFTENIGLLAALVFALTGSVLFIGKLATDDAPCLALVALATALTVTGRSTISAAGAGALLALAVVTAYAGLTLVPFVLLLAFLATPAADDGDGSRTLPRGGLRGGTATLTLVGLVAVGYRRWDSGVADGVRLAVTGRPAQYPAAVSAITGSLLDDIGLVCALAVGGIALLLVRRSWARALVLAVMAGAGLAAAADSYRIGEPSPLGGNTAFTGLFCAVPAAVALSWALSKRSRITVLGLALLWLLLIDGLWRSNVAYSWPSSILGPVNKIKSLGISGQYFSFDSDAGEYYSKGRPAIAWYPAAEAYSIFTHGASRVRAAEKSHKFTGFLFQTMSLDARDRDELHVLQRSLAADSYYRETATFPVSAAGPARWQLWIHYPAGNRG
jgi:hypothetical protein